MGIPVPSPARRLIFLLAAAFTVLSGGIVPLWGQPTLISQPIPALNLASSGAAQTVNLTNYIQNPNATGTVVRIAVGTLSTSATTLAPSSMVLLGNIDIALTDNLTPQTVANFLAYINAGDFVDNIIHRSVTGFIIQGGGFNFTPVDGNAVAGLVPTFAPVPYEQGLSNVAGTIAMAQVSGNQNSATSQWFINLVDNSSNLDSQDGGFCAFGTVLGNGMAVANAVAALPQGNLTSYAADLSSNATVQENIAGAWTNVPLANFNGNLFLTNFVFTNISQIPALTFTASSGNTSLVTAGVSGNALTLTPVASAGGSTTITVTATDTEGAIFQTTFAVTIAPALTITSPANNTTVTNASLTVSGTATDNGVGAGIASVTVNGITANGDTATGSDVADWNATITLSPGANTITVVATDTLNNSSQQQITVTYTPPSLPVFSTQPANTTVIVGNTATFTTTASGIPTPTYQWQISTDGGTTWSNLTDGSGISGSATGLLAISNTSIAMSGDQFQCVATNSVGPATSKAVILTVASNPNAPLFTLQASAQTVAAGQTAKFTVAASGKPTPTYQWQREAAGTSAFVNLTNGGSYSGVTTATLSVSNTTVVMTGDQFQCVATNSLSTATSNPAALTVNIATATVTLSNLTQTYTGAARTVTVKTSPAGLAVNVTYNGSTTAPTASGSYAVVATITDPNHAGAATGTLVINKSTATLSISNTSQAYTGTAKSVTVTTNPAGLAYSVTYNGSATPPVSGGSYAVVATITDPNSAGSKTGTLTITKATQTITFGALALEKVGNAPLALTATASSGLAVTYASSNAAVATVSNGTVTLVGKGTATITASQTGNADYNAAGNVTQTLTVDQAPAFTTAPANKTVTAGQTASFTVAASGLPAPSYQWQREAAGTSTFVNLANGGSYSGVTTATLSVSNTTVIMTGDQFQCVALNSAGSFPSNPATLAVNKAPATVTLSNLTQTYTGTARVVTVATSPSGLAFNVTYNGSATAPTIPGSYAVVATVTDANHAGTASGTLVINKSTATLTLSNLSQAYTGSAKTVTVATSPAGLAYSVTYNGSATAPVNGGSYAVVATITDPYSAGSKTGTLTITKAAQTISFGALAVEKVGNAAFALTATASSGLPVTYASSNSAVATVGNGTVTLVGKGTATITASQAGNANYNAAANVTQTLTVNQAPAFTTQPANKTVTSGQAATFTVAATGLPAPTYQWQRMAAGTSTFVNLASSGGYTGVATATLSVSGTTVTMAGDQFQCVATNTAGAATSTAATLTVNKAPATVTLSNLTQTYTGGALAVKVATNPASLAFNVTYNGSTTAPIAAGNYTVVATITDANHAGSATGTLVINKATATVTLSNLSQTYDGTAKSATVATNPTELTVNVTYNGSATPPMNAGSYPVVATVVDANYTGTTKGTLTIGKAAQIITFGDIGTVQTGEGPLFLTATASSGLPVMYTSSNATVAMVSGDSLNLVTGTAIITALQAGNANYNAAAKVSQTLTVVAGSSSDGGSVDGGGGGGVEVSDGAGGFSGTVIGSVTTINPVISDPNPFVVPPIVWSIVNNGDSAAWVSGIDSSSISDEPSPTAADLPALLLEAMNLNITSPSSLLPSASVVMGVASVIDDEPINQDLFLTLQYRQSKDLGSLSLVPQYSADDVNWIAVPAADLTQLPDADAETEQWSASIAVPTVGPIYLRLEVSQSP